MRRIGSKIRPEIAEEQCGLSEGKGTSDAIYIIRSLTERTIEVKKRSVPMFNRLLQAI